MLNLYVQRSGSINLLVFEEEFYVNTLSGMADGLSLLDLGCGWGSVALFMAQRFPNSSGKS